MNFLAALAQRFDHDALWPRWRAVHLHSAAGPIILGIALLFFGRRLFWLFVAGVGFLYGLRFAPLVFHGGTEMNFLLVGLFCGVVGVVLALAAQKIAVGLAGFLMGGYLALSLLTGGQTPLEHFQIIPFLIGGVLGTFLMGAIFRWALVILSSIAGSVLIVEDLQPGPEVNRLLVLLLALLGIYVQAGLARPRRLPEEGER